MFRHIMENIKKQKKLEENIDSIDKVKYHIQTTILDTLRVLDMDNIMNTESSGTIKNILAPALGFDETVNLAAFIESEAHSYASKLRASARRLAGVSEAGSIAEHAERRAASIESEGRICVSRLRAGARHAADYSAPGATSDTAAMGFIIGGSMLASVSILAAIPVGLGFLGYRQIKSSKRNNLIRALSAAIDEFSKLKTFIGMNEHRIQLAEEMSHVQKLIDACSEIRYPLTRRGFWS